MEKDRFDKFYHYVSSSLKSIQRLRSFGMEPYGLTGAHTMCLRQLYNNPEGLTRTEITRLCDIDKAQTSRIINDLCAKGQVIETENENINYRKCLRLTHIGKNTTEEINRLVLRINQMVSEKISDGEMEAFYATFEKIFDGFKSAETEIVKN